MAIFTCHPCRQYRHVDVQFRVPNPGSILCLTCGEPMFWMPDHGEVPRGWTVQGYVPRPQVLPQLIVPVVPQIVQQPVPVQQPVQVQQPAQMEDNAETRQEIAGIWTPGSFGDGYANAMSHWERHADVNGAHYASCLAYVHAAEAFYQRFRASRVPQAKNPRVEYVHNCTATSQSATLLVVNVEPGNRKYRFASFYDMTPGRFGQSIQKQLVELTGVDESILF